ncbi:MAG: M28 family peptidase [Verrucomicrobia bacterium]|nr:M28 family peptidase [Verrucomicrobiota bacterium]MBV9657378.1 M28 family peptidase [Verrucomicrobiota bacterium]
MRRKILRRLRAALRLPALLPWLLPPSLLVCAGIAACGRSTANSAAASSPTASPRSGLWNEYSGARAFANVEQIVNFGPRPSGSEALEKSRVFIETRLKKCGWTVERQTFTAQTPRGPLEFVNLIARRADASASTPRAVVCSHYDTKKFDDPGLRFVGANDGGSSTGALLELARVLTLDPTFAREIELVFFDGEEGILAINDHDGLYGSRHYAADLRQSGRAKQFKLGILWDMMGDRDLDITLSPNSPPKLARGIFAAADALGTRAHFGYFRDDIIDDHVPLNAAGIPTIDLIDFDYPPWHTEGDTLDKISAESLEIVARATIYCLYQVAPELH